MSKKNERLKTQALGFFGLFVTFTVVVGLNFFAKLDTQATIFFQKVIPHLLDLPFSFLSFLGSFEVTAAVLAAILISKYGRSIKPAIYVVFAFIIGTLAELSGKLYLFHPSPPKLFFRHVDILFPTTYVHTNYSYPSGHMFRTTFIIVLLLYYLSSSKNRVSASTFFVISLLLMAISRIYLGEHWLSDVVGGILLGALFGVLSIGFLKSTKYFSK